LKTAAVQPSEIVGLRTEPVPAPVSSYRRTTQV
jgi:hypothetical protein